MESLLIAENIRSFFPEAGPVYLTVSPGQRYYLQGRESVCTALFEMLTGLKKPDEGTVTIQGQSIYDLSPRELAAFRRDRLGAIPRGGGFLPELSLLDQVKLPMAGLSREEITRRIQENARLPIHDLFNPGKRCSDRTLALAGLLRATVLRPPALIMDDAYCRLNRRDSMLVWKETEAALGDGTTLLYLGSAPAPGDILWDKTMQISGR